MKLITTLSLSAAMLTASTARAQFSMDWYTIDAGGGDTVGGTFALSSTIGQPDAGALTGGAFQITGGYWAGTIPACYANCDGSTVVPILNVNDFQCFLNKFAAADLYANCDNSTNPPVLNVNDFQCFLNKYAGGCS